jgi:hypothetical protein
MDALLPYPNKKKNPTHSMIIPRMENPMRTRNTPPKKNDEPYKDITVRTSKPSLSKALRCISVMKSKVLSKQISTLALCLWKKKRKVLDKPMISVTPAINKIWQTRRGGEDEGREGSQFVGSNQKEFCLSPSLKS